MMNQNFRFINSVHIVVFYVSLFCTFKSSAQFAKGADVGWLSQMEASGRRFYDNNGVQKDLFDILKSKGVNSIRYRVWVNPAGGWCRKKDIAVMAKRAADKGFRIMIDFHYSDNWADPGKQTKPAAWSNYNFTQLTKAVYDHTFKVLDTLKILKIIPDWVQVGNETNNGMLWEEGKASVSMRNFATLVSSGYDAVKAVFPSSKVLVHISNGYENSLFRWMFDGLRSNNAKYDVIAISLYPEVDNWQTLNTQCLSNMRDISARYGKEIVISEVGMASTAAVECKAFLTDLMVKVKSVNGGLGIFYWEPQSFNWQGYGKGAWNSNGRPTVALDAFIETPTGLDESIGGANMLRYYPNPFIQSFTIIAGGDFIYTITDMTGKAVENGEGQYSAQAGHSLNPGMYFLRMTSSNGFNVRKITKM